MVSIVQQLFTQLELEIAIKQIYALYLGFRHDSRGEVSFFSFTAQPMRMNDFPVFFCSLDQLMYVCIKGPKSFVILFFIVQPLRLKALSVLFLLFFCSFKQLVYGQKSSSRVRQRGFSFKITVYVLSYVHLGRACSALRAALDTRDWEKGDPLLCLGLTKVKCCKTMINSLRV